MFFTKLTKIIIKYSLLSRALSGLHTGSEGGQIDHTSRMRGQEEPPAPPYRPSWSTDTKDGTVVKPFQISSQPILFSFHIRDLLTSE